MDSHLQKDILQYNPNIYPECKLARAFSPQIQFTCFKFKPEPGIYDQKDPIVRSRNENLLKSLSNLVPSVPVIRARYMLNACHINGFDEWWNQVTEEDQEALAIEWGCELQDLKNAAKSSNIIILGDKYATPSVLAHEIGHYICSKELAGKSALKAHRKYGSSKKSIDRWKLSGDACYSTALMIALLTGQTWVTALGFTVKSIASMSSIYYGRNIINAEAYASSVAMGLLEKVGATEEEITKFYMELYSAWSTYHSRYNKLYKSEISSSFKWLMLALSHPLFNVSQVNEFYYIRFGFENIYHLILVKDYE